MVFVTFAAKEAALKLILYGGPGDGLPLASDGMLSEALLVVTNPL